MAARASAALADRNEELLLTDLVLAECVYVLESFYEVQSGRVAELMRSAIALRTVKVADRELLLRALEVYDIDRLDFAEAYLVARAEAGDTAEILSFDRSIDRIDTVTRREP
jgi:predicted nucleic-acid-binding protein